jgi:2-dehydro-3-deoxyphosphogalactonate aldolase
VFPKTVPMYAVGGVGVDNLHAFRAAGATGAGVGSSLYAPGVALDELARRALALRAAWGEG